MIKLVTLEKLGPARLRAGQNRPTQDTAHRVREKLGQNLKGICSFLLQVRLRNE